MIIKTLKSIFLIIMCFIIVSCESNTYDEISKGTILNPTYEVNIKSMMNSYCTSCHSVSGSKPDVPFETYQQVVDRATIISCRIDGTTCSLMPASGRIPQIQIDIFNLWIIGGYKQK